MTLNGEKEKQSHFCQTQMTTNENTVVKNSEKCTKILILTYDRTDMGKSGAVVHVPLQTGFGLTLYGNEQLHT